MRLSEYVKELLYSTKFTVDEKYVIINKYVHFITQPLTLSMFIPAKLVNGKWVVLEEPNYFVNYLWSDPKELGMKEATIKECDEYKKALDNVIFKGCKIYKRHNDFILDDVSITELKKQDYER